MLEFSGAAGDREENGGLTMQRRAYTTHLFWLLLMLLATGVLVAGFLRLSFPLAAASLVPFAAAMRLLRYVNIEGELNVGRKVMSRNLDAVRCAVFPTGMLITVAFAVSAYLLKDMRYIYAGIVPFATAILSLIRR